MVDAQLPLRISRWLKNQGYDSIHTQNLPLKNATTDTQINDLSILEKRIVITKDKDFLNSFLLENKPYELLLITTENIRNQELEQLLSKNFEEITKAFQTNKLVEINQNTLIIHC